MLLLAEDDEDDRQLASEAHEEAGVTGELHCVGDGDALLDYLKGRGDYADRSAAPAPSLVLLDLNMPRRDGREALAAMRADHALRCLPVIVLTTSSATEDVRSAYELGANSFITKPVTYTGLVDVMRDVERYWFERVTLPPTVAG